MKKVISCTLVLVIVLSIFAACSAQEHTPITTTYASDSTETDAPFDLDGYEEAVGQFRTHVMDNSLLLYNVGNYEINYLNALQSISGSTSNETAEKGFEWLSKQTDATRETVDAAHQTIRDEYAELILVEVDGKEAEALDGYVHSMYEGYAALYDCVTSNSLNASQLTTKINDAIGLINGANDDIGLFIGE